MSDLDPRLPPAPHVIAINTMTFVKIVGIGLGLWLVWEIRAVVAIVFASLLLAALIDPLADWFAIRKIPRGIAVVIVYILLALMVMLGMLVLVPVIIQQITQLLNSGWFSPEVVEDVKTRLTALLNVQDLARTISQAFLEGNSGVVTGIANRVMDLLNAVISIFAVLMLTFYIVVEEDSAKKYFRNFAPVEYQPFLIHIMNKMQEKIGAWLRGQIVLGFIVGFAVWIGLAALGMPYALLLAVIAGLLEIVPYVGPIASAVPAVIVAFTISPMMGLLVLGLYIIVQQLENNILVPKVMQKFIGLNPVVSIVALLIGFEVGGIVGSILAIPVATMIQVVLEELFANRSVSAPRG